MIWEVMLDAETKRLIAEGDSPYVAYEQAKRNITDRYGPRPAEVRSDAKS
jgi:hypothetical protein